MDLEAVARRLELEQLYTDYAHCLDADELERWPDFFTEDCFYRIISVENYDAGLPLRLIYATSRNMLKDRVSALREANIYEPQRYRHLISSIKDLTRNNCYFASVPKIIENAAAGPLELVANFLVVRTMQDGEMTIFGAGRYVDRVKRDAGSWKFASKIVVLDSRQIDTSLAIPI
jgi:anthranilate 1,2-dioxygenase small subunit